MLRRHQLIRHRYRYKATELPTVSLHDLWTLTRRLFPTFQCTWWQSRVEFSMGFRHLIWTVALLMQCDLVHSCSAESLFGFLGSLAYCSKMIQQFYAVPLERMPLQNILYRKAISMLACASIFSRSLDTRRAIFAGRPFMACFRSNVCWSINSDMNFWV